MSTSLALQDHFVPIEFPVTNDPERYFAVRFFRANKYFHKEEDPNRKQTIIDPETKEKIEIVNGKRKRATVEEKEEKAINDIKNMMLFTSFTNGTVLMDYEHRNMALKHIAYDIETGCIGFWNQIGYEQEGFRLVIDIDAHDRVLSNPEIERMGNILIRTMKEYFSDFEEKPVIVVTSKCGPRLKKGKLSTGLHFIGHVKVTLEQAKQIIFAYRIRLKKHQFNMKGLEVDAAVYRSNSRTVSLRMIHSHKKENCPMCSNDYQDRFTCTFCMHRGEVMSKWAYVPVAVFDKDGKINDQLYEKFHSDFQTMVQSHSVWSVEGEERNDYQKPPMDPSYVLEEEDQQARKKKRMPGMTATQMKRRQTALALAISNPGYENLQLFIRNIYWKGKRWWSDVEISNIDVTQDKRIAFINLSSHSPGCSMCLYAMKDHGGNRIYFTLSRKGILTHYCRSEKKEYDCKSKKKITFQVRGEITNAIFGIEGPPALIPTYVDRNKNWKSHVTMDSLATKPQQTDQTRNVKSYNFKRNKQERNMMAKELHIRELQKLYGLGKK